MIQENFIVYKSSAGSGKTYTLVKAYLKLALSDPHRINRAYKQILAVTFTNKAAAEMKDRILQALKQINLLEKIPLSSDLQTELHISEAELQVRCKVLHQCLLHQYADFSVSTIDSFVYRLIKRFSIDLQLPANFMVDTDEEGALWWAIDELLTNMQQHKQLQELLLHYASEKVDEQKNWKIEKELFDLAKPVLIAKKDSPEANLLGLSKLDDLLQIKKELQESVQATEKTMLAFADKAYRIIDEKNIGVTDFSYGEKGFFSYFRKIKDKQFGDDELKSTRVDDAVLRDKWYPAKTSHADIDGVKERLRSLYYEVEAFREKQISRYFLHKMLVKNLTALCLLNEIQELIRVYKEEKNVVFISEFNKTVSTFIQDEPVPFIYERLGDRYKHYLIDEFQDTSTLQWLNLLPLVHNSLAEGKFCMIVGDGKQSIYRWRGADVEQFINLPEIKSVTKNKHILEQQQALTTNYIEKQLNSNRRSYHEIIQFNNELFHWLANTYLSPEHQKVYAHSEQLSFNKEGGKISLSFIQTDKKEQDDPVLYKILEHINEALGKGFTYRDMAILTRNNRNGSKAAQFLMQQAVPVVSSDSLLLKNCAEVNFVISFFCWLSNQQDAISAAAILGYLKEHLQLPVTHCHLKQVANAPYQLSDILLDIHPEMQIDHLPALPLFEIATEIIRLFHLADRHALFVNFFLDEVSSFNERENASLFLFLQWWSKKKDNLSVKIPQDTNAVKVLSVHASKGLEFPIVILPYADWKLQNTEQILIDTENEITNLPVALVKTGKDLERTRFKQHSEEEEQKQILDNLNVLYVACTRAVVALHLICRKKKQGDCITNWLQHFLRARYQTSAETESFEWGYYPESPSEKKINPEVLDPIQYRDIHKSIAIKLSDYDFSLADKRIYGLAMHAILAQINTESDIDLAIQRVVLHGTMSSEQVVRIEKQVRQLVNHPELKTYFSSSVQVKNERELFLENGDIIRPDRIVSDSLQHTIIDFKTGEKSDKHIKQLLLYKYTLRRMTPKKVRAFLVYLPDEVVEVI